jgi:radical SAM-linked protein
MVRQRIRIRFSKQDNLRWISHRDLLRTLERLFRRAELKLGMTEGFHPRPRMSFPLALGVGIAAQDEVMELELAETCDADDILNRLRRHAVPGLEFNSVEVLASGEPKRQVESVTLECPVPAARRAETARAIDRFLAEDACLVNRPNRDMPVDIRQDVRQLRLQDDRLLLQLEITAGATARPQEVLAAIGLDALEDDGYYLTRTTVQLAKQEEL